MVAKITQKLKSHEFVISLVTFIILGQVMLWNALPTALQVSNHPISMPPESLSIPNSTPLNQLYIENEGTFHQFNSEELYQSRAKMEYWGDNHLLLPIYRALKTGQHLSNVGYNEGFFQKNRSEVDPMQYQSIFSSTWNNMAQVLYAFIPQRLRHIQNPEQEYEVSKIITIFRYVLSYIHLLGMILFFIVSYKRLGKFYAYGFALILVFNPGIFFSTGNLYDFILAPLFLLSYTVYFYPLLVKQYSHKNMILFTLGFTLISGIFNIFGSLYYQIYTWAPVIATLFFIELYFLYEFYINGTNNIRQILYAIGRVLIIAIISILPLAIISLIEIKEMVTLYGIESLDIFKQRQSANFMGTVYLNNEYQKIKNIKEFLIHMSRYYEAISEQFATIPALWMERFMPSLLLFIPQILLRLKVLCLLMIFVVFLGYCYRKLRKLSLPIFIYTGFAIFCFLTWTLGLNIISTVAAYHQHISGYVYSTYIDIMIVFLVVYALQKIKNTDKKILE